MSFNLITCIVERGKAKKIVDSAIDSGAQAATLFYARGKGVKEKLGLIGKFIMPEKEVVLIVTKQEQTQAVFDHIVATGRLTEPGKGFVYIQPVLQTVGFLQ